MNYKRLGQLAGYLIEFGKYILLYPIAMIHYRNRSIFLISERGNDARDNGWYMFKYFRETHPEIEAYYVITDDSVDRAKLLKYGNIVSYRSLDHYIKFIAADYKISTHIMGCAPYGYFYRRFRKYIPLKGKYISLKHGIVKDDLLLLHAENSKLDLLICGAKPEYEYIQKNFHYKRGEVRYTGLARYDGLNDYSLKQQVLIMPTWRNYLSSVDTNEIRNSIYVQKWNEVLQDKALNELAETYDIKFIFYPHYEMQKHLQVFQSNNSNVVIADFEHYDVQTLLKESVLLVTDYSSVYFDFAYMHKPCIYYQFDKKDVFERHYYKKGYFNYENMGFGEVVDQKDELIKILTNYVKNGFKVNEKYCKRMDSFFELRDNKNCERIFSEIQKL